MGTEPTSQRSRRAILTGAAGGIAAVVVAQVARPLDANATVQPYVQIGVSGADNTVGSVTTVTNAMLDGLAGVSNGSGAGVVGNATSGPGVSGVSSTGYGVKGTTISDDHPAVLGWSQYALTHGRNTGVHGYSGSSNPPATPSDTGVFGSSQFGDGVVGLSNGNFGVSGKSGTGIGVYGDTVASALPAVRGVSYGDGTAVQGHTGPSLPPAGPANTAIHGYASNSTSSVGVRGESPAGRGGWFKGGAAAVRLIASSAASHPSSGQRGDLFVDNSGRLWFCRTGTTWVRLA